MTHNWILFIVFFTTSSSISYSQPFSKVFKDFDQSNGYKGLKFGTQISIIKKSTKIDEPNEYKLYAVSDKKYKNWFEISFDKCSFIFNKKKQFDGVLISKYKFSEKEYATLLSDALELFGNTNDYKAKDDLHHTETTTWHGNNVVVIFFRIDDEDINVEFLSTSLNDMSESDKLY